VRAVVQRVIRARVTVEDRVIGDIGPGLLVFVGVSKHDTSADVASMAAKIRDMRVFGGDTAKPMDRSIVQSGGSVLVVSQFTLYGDMRKGRRPSFDEAAPPAVARALYEELVRELRASGLTVQTGEFQAMMHVELVNDGPVTILIDSTKQF
jgi:D-tyrosyl-tRNA(Tyr) deacylase